MSETCEIKQIENMNNLEENALQSENALQEDLNKILDKKESELNVMSLKITNLENELQESFKEREDLKSKVTSLESELIELKKPNTLNPAQQQEVYKIKKVSEEMLTRAKGIIFDKTKICKNQELQIEALTQQVNSLKEVLQITKDLLEIRNMEVKHLQEKMECMDAKINAERHKQDLMNKKMEAVVQMNSDLKGEYETQLKLFDALRVSYANREELEKKN